MTSEPDRARRWRTSSYSGSGNNCVQVTGQIPTVVTVRDSKDPEGPVLVFAAAAWQEFTRAVKVGGLDVT